MRSGTKAALSLLAVFASVWLCLRFLLPLFAPFLLGTLLALAAEPMVAFLCRRARFPRGLGTGVGVSLTLVLGVLTILSLGAFLVRELGLLAKVLPDLETAAGSGAAFLEGQLLRLSARAPKAIRPMVEENVASLFSGGTALLRQGGRYLLGLAGNLLSHVPHSALTLGTGVISAFLISAKLPALRRKILRLLPRQRLRTILSALKGMKSALGGWLLAQCKLMGVTFFLLLLGFWLLRIPYAPAWAAGVALVDAFPVLGTGTVLLPWALVCLLQGDTARALGLAGIYVTVSLTRSVLEPRLVGRQLGLDPLVTLVALYAGYQLWGFGGMLLAPMLAVAAVQLTSRPQGGWAAGRRAADPGGEGDAS